MQFSQKTQLNFMFYFSLNKYLTSFIILETTRPTITTTASLPTPAPVRRQDSDVDNEIEDERRRETKTNPGAGAVSKAMCSKLRVPCRFVTEHPCCKLPQDIGMLGR